jgi:hypothetical protein
VKLFNRAAAQTQRPLSAVPRGVVIALALALAVQAAFRLAQAPPSAEGADLPPAPPVPMLKLAAFGEPQALAKLMMMYLQAYDYRADNKIPFQKLDYGVLTQWLHAMLVLDPDAQYPLFAASRIYADIPDQAKTRVMLDFIYREFTVDPDRRWPALATAALLAKHRLSDLPLALRYATAIATLTKGPGVPAWARQMRIFLLEDMNEFELAKVLVAGLVRNGNIHDPAELRFLQQRLEALEQQTHAH